MTKHTKSRLVLGGTCKHGHVMTEQNLTFVPAKNNRRAHHRCRDCYTAAKKRSNDARRERTLADRAAGKKPVQKLITEENDRTPERRRFVIEKLEEGWTAKQIYDYLGISYSVFYQWANRRGIRPVDYTDPDDPKFAARRRRMDRVEAAKSLPPGHFTEPATLHAMGPRKFVVTCVACGTDEPRTLTYRERKRAEWVYAFHAECHLEAPDEDDEDDVEDSEEAA